MQLEPFKITIKNTCDVFASFTVNLEVLEGSTLQSKYLKGQVNREEPSNLSALEATNTTISNSIESRVLARGSLGSDDEEDYTVRLWMDESVTLADTEAINKTFKSKIVITGQPSTYSPVEQGITKLSEAMLANEYQTSVEVAKNKIAAKNTPDFSKTAPITEWQEVHELNEETITADKPHPSLYGKNELGAGGIDAESAKLIFGKNYSFDSNNATYILEDRIEVDPTTITDFTSENYYFCGGYTYINNQTGLMSHTNSTDCRTLYEVNSISTTTTGTEETNTYRLRYTIKGKRFTYTEAENDKSDKGLYQALDDLGVSYYYRGNVRNNFVKFAGYYWRIIRRNGDGTVRLIYNGSNPFDKGENTKAFNTPFHLKYDNPAYAGYMHGNTLNASKEQTQANEKDSNIKEQLENWYEEKGSFFDNYVADEIFCNDRSVTSGNGYATNVSSFYGADNRLIQNKTPTLKCPQENDKFTVSNTLGNGKNAHPIGLITADELSMAGSVYNFLNKSFYLYTGGYYWTMTPIKYFEGDNATYIQSLNYDGSFSPNWAHGNFDVRPVINLKENVEITGGIGTSNDPFVVKE